MTAATAAPTTDEAAIRALLTAHEVQRVADVEAIVARYAPDAVVYDLAPPLRHAAPTAAGLAEWLATHDGEVGVEVTGLHVTVGGDVAFAHSLNRMHGGEFEMWFRSTVCLRRDGDGGPHGGWLIAHEHTSTPFRMDGSFLAATDLTP